jgi:D-alanyl-D-alanine carboxypeptidase
MTPLRRVILLATIFLAACQTQAALPSLPVPTGTALPAATLTPTSTSTLTPTPAPTLTPVPTLFPRPTSGAPLIACSERRPSDDLYVLVNSSFGLDPDYVPPDLISLGDYVPGNVTPPDLLLRRAAAEALGRLVRAMQADGPAPTVLSAYRGYYDQIVVYQKWQEQDPAYVSQISAVPGHSEHQLGTAVDFGSPELPALTGDLAAKFSPRFAETSEGRWLAAHAHEYGFTLTSPPGAEAWTGLTYEPWHYRYVGVDLAAYLRASGYFLAEYLYLTMTGLPCLPGMGGR